MDFDLTRGIEILERTPRVVRALVSDLPPGWTAGTEGPETFSAFDNVGHLIDGEETDWIPRARIILAQAPGAGRRFEPYDRFRHRRISAGKSLADLLDRFSSLRADNITTLRGFRLTTAQMALTGEHPELGTVTLAQLLATWVVHDLGHIAQISRVMAKQFGGAVGPWRAYLPILTR